jgi:hypothetical protein
VPGTTIQQDISKYESEPYDLARRQVSPPTFPHTFSLDTDTRLPTQEREAMAEANRKRIGAAFKAMSHGVRP